jgi:FixJ family two-component response regulator
MSGSPTVYIVDDDKVVRHALALLIETAGYTVQAFGSAESFLEASSADWRGCLILDVRMPGMDGPTLHQVMREHGIKLPVIFLTAHGNIPLTVRAIKAGAMDFLTKPVEAKVLLERIGAAMNLNSHFVEAQGRLSSLTEREQEVMQLAVAGKSNKEIARELDISPRTVEIHRSRVMHKTNASSLLELADYIKEIERWN